MYSFSALCGILICVLAPLLYLMSSPTSSKSYNVLHRRLPIELVFSLPSWPGFHAIFNCHHLLRITPSASCALQVANVNICKAPVFHSEALIIIISNVDIAAIDAMSSTKFRHEKSKFCQLLLWNFFFLISRSLFYCDIRAKLKTSLNCEKRMEDKWVVRVTFFKYIPRTGWWVYRPGRGRPISSMYTMSMCLYVYTHRLYTENGKLKKGKEKILCSKSFATSLAAGAVYSMQLSQQPVPSSGRLLDVSPDLFSFYFHFVEEKKKKKKKNVSSSFLFLSCVFFSLFSLLPYIFSTMSSVAKPLRSPFSMDCKYLPSLSLIKDRKISGTKQLRF